MNISMIQSLINAIEKPAIFIDHHYVIKAINQAYSEHYQQEVVLGKSHCYQISHQATKPCDQHGEDCPLMHCKTSNTSHRVLHIHNNGNNKEYCNILMRPVVNDDGITVGFLEILEQVSYASHQSESDKLIGISPTFKQMIEMINRCAQSDISVLLHGDTGTGKELAAKAIHQASTRSTQPFIVLECTGLSEALFESELFGHEKGAFTGANTHKKGLIDLVQGGTLFLDEVGDIPLNLQVKLLRLLETGTYRTVGGVSLKQANFRLICASHKNLQDMVAQHQFRHDLYYRLAAFPLYLPSLTERKEDIPLLAKHYLAESQLHQKYFSLAAINALVHYPFPGNIRELKNIVERSILMNDNDEIDVVALGLYQHNTRNHSIDNAITLAQVEKQHLALLCINNDKQSAQAVADILGISKRTFYRKLNHHQLTFSK
jgi:transcriptional regulator with PAS, ATPase and Fis domain